MQSFCQSLARRKRNIMSDCDDTKTTQLARVLNLFDLTALGVGSTLGLGVYVLAGAVAYELAGPAVVISFLVGAIASAFAALCYAEFATRVPKAGSAYIYTYVSVGELVAFIIGWNLILEYIIGTSSVARGLSGYLDTLFDNQMESYFKENLPININFLADYPDFLSFFLVILMTILLASGVKESSILNNIFTLVNLLTVLVIIVAGSIKADPANWSIAKETIPDGVNGGEGGFMPFGIAGVMAGAAKCFYGFIGFDCVATTGEEAKNPKRDIPLAIVLSLIIIFLTYFGISTVLTMMWPYYLQDPLAPFPHVFQEFGWIEIKWCVSIGAIFALCTSLFGAMFPLPRIIYAMASDGLIYKWLKSINHRTQTPVKATLLSGFLAAILALIFNLQQLIDMMSIGCLLAYTIVAICVLILRYENDDAITLSASAYHKQQLPSASSKQIIKQIFNLNFLKVANELSSLIVKSALVIFIILTIILSILISFIDFETFENIYNIFTIIIVAGMLCVLLVTVRQPVSSTKLTFKVPLVPLIPCSSIFINIYLMVQLDINTWIRFVVWIILGFIIYFTYGVRKSTEAILYATEIQNEQISSIHYNNRKAVMTIPTDRLSRSEHIGAIINK